MIDPQESEDPRRYLDPEVLAKISALDLRARLVVEGFVSGLHRSPYHGFSVEFAEHRQYVQGDDLRRLDWKVFGRTDKLYIKQYEEETNLTLHLLVDASESMDFRFGSAGMTKFDYAATLAAALAHLALGQSDAVGLTVFDEKIRETIRPSNNPAHWKSLVRALEGAVGPRKTSIGDAMAETAERLPHRSLVVLISDLFDDPESVLRGLQRIRYGRHEVMALQVVDPAERDFPFDSPTLFEGLEQTGRMVVEPRSLKRRYLDEFEGFVRKIQRGCRELHIEYAMFDTSERLDVALSSFLASRAARIK